MHARTCVILNRFSHETSGYPMRTRLLPHDPFEAHNIIRCLHHIFAVMQCEFILTRCIFGNHGLCLDPCLFSARVNIRKKRQHTVQVIDGIDLSLAARFTSIQNVTRRAHFAIGIAFVVEEEKLQLERARRFQPLGRKRIDLPLQGMARIRGHRTTVEFIERQEHLGPWWRGIVERL